MNVIAYCVEEVERQGHDTSTLDGIERVGWMLDAWSYALSHDRFGKLLFADVLSIGERVERLKNRDGLRAVDVWVGRRKCPSPNDVPPMLMELLKDPPSDPLDFYRRLLEIHPFVDGNGRTGKVILNWLNGSLLNPVFPPSDFWGTPIRNP